VGGREAAAGGAALCFLKSCCSAARTIPFLCRFATVSLLFTKFCDDFSDQVQGVRAHQRMACFCAGNVMSAALSNPNITDIFFFEPAHPQPLTSVDQNSLLQRLEQFESAVSRQSSNHAPVGWSASAAAAVDPPFASAFNVAASESSGSEDLAATSVYRGSGADSSESSSATSVFKSADISAMLKALHFIHVYLSTIKLIPPPLPPPSSSLLSLPPCSSATMTPKPPPPSPPVLLTAAPAPSRRLPQPRPAPERSTPYPPPRRTRCRHTSMAFGAAASSVIPAFRFNFFMPSPHPSHRTKTICHKIKTLNP
jgi:hypothetical protein